MFAYVNNCDCFGFPHFMRHYKLYTFDSVKCLFSEAFTGHEVRNSGSGKESLTDHSWQSDHAMYHGFLALHDLTLAILGNAKLASRNSLGHSSSAEDNLTFSSDEPLHDVEVQILSAKEHVKQVFPCEFRLEVLENAFALLFARFEHLAEAGRCLSESMKSLDIAGSGINLNEVRDQEVSAERTSCGDRRKKVVYQKTSVQTNNKRSSETASDEHRAAKLSMDDVTSVEQTDGGFTASRFLVSSAVILNILTMIQECLNDLDDHVQENSLPSEAKHTNNVASCSLRQRSRKLHEYVTEALWRHKLVAPRDAVQEHELGSLSNKNWHSESDGTSGIEITLFQS